MEKVKDYYEIYSIPREFKIFSKTIKVFFDEKLADRFGYNGLSNFKESTILIQPSCESYYRDYEDVKITFWHEVVHFVLKNLNYDEMAEDEEFIRLFAPALRQVIATSKYTERIIHAK